LLLLGAAVASCTRKGDPPAPERPPGPTRGERVVVEARAADFFEGRVLSVSESRLRVEPAQGGDPISVTVADVYRLPGAPIVAPHRDQLLVCRVESAWIGCRVEAVEGERLRVSTLAGASATIPTNAVLLPTALTELNLRQRFARVAERRRFREGARAAGKPVAPPAFRVLPRARVIAERAGAWYGGVIHEIEDSDAYVRFDGTGLSERVPNERIVPEPPYPAAPARGDFALVRPLSPAEPWSPVRVVAVTAQDFKVADENGEERVVIARDLLPLVP
jgi:hypothetical protein